MEPSRPTILRIGEWRVDATSGVIARNGATIRLEARTMRLLLYLAEHAGQTVSIDDLLDQVWSGITVTSDSVYQAVASLRKQLGDDPKQPTYIATVPRLGYRMIAPVGPWQNSSSTLRVRRKTGFAAAIVAAFCIVSVAIFLIHNRVSTSPNQASAAVTPATSVGVVPFLDLTEGMKEEEFADGMTEELITRLSKVQGLRVPSPTASFYLKGKQMSVAEMAGALNANYLVDGSVRKSGSRVRIAARLLRAENGFVIWSETYERSFDDILKVQDDIAGNVTKALTNSIGAQPDHSAH